MKLTQRQLDKIAGLINEEANVRKELHESMYSNRKKSVVNEMLMSEAEMSAEAVPDYLRMAIEDEFLSSPNSITSALLKAVNSLIYQNLSDLMKKTGKESWSPMEWEKEISLDGNNTDLEMNFCNDLSDSEEFKSILQNYAMSIANAALALGSSSDEDLEPRYSEYE
jgi:uncharacterized protein YehS (DUF1456 family)